VALINTIRGYVYQEGHRLPEKFFAGPTWAPKLARLPVSAPLKLILATFMTSIEALATAERQLTDRMLAIQDPRCALLETIPAIGPLTARVLAGALGEASRFDDKKAVANYGALTPTIYQSGGVTHLGAINRDERLEVRRCCCSVPIAWPGSKSIMGRRRFNSSTLGSPADGGRRSRSWRWRASC